MNRTLKSWYTWLPVVAALVVLPTAATYAAEDPQVSSSGNGAVEAQPDIAIVSGHITLQRDTPEEAVNSVREKLDQVIKALAKSGIDSRDIQAAQVIVNPQYHYQRDKPRKLSGYQGSANFTAKLRDLKGLSKLYGVVFKAGATELQPTQFDFSNRDDLELQAITKAVEIAKRKAEAGLKPLGQKVGKVLLLNVDTRWHQPPMYKGARMAMMSEAADAAPQVNVGDRKIEATVSATFSIR